MTPAKSSKSSPRITCYGTAFLAHEALDAKLLMQGIAAAVPQFSSPRLDASFLINCGRLFAGGWATMDSAPSAYVKRVAGADFRSPKGAVIYQCSAELQVLLAALTPLRAAQMASEWYDKHAPQTVRSARLHGLTQIRLAILKNLAALAVQGRDQQTHLMLRVDYRKKR